LYSGTTVKEILHQLNMMFDELCNHTQLKALDVILTSQSVRGGDAIATTLMNLVRSLRHSLVDCAFEIGVSTEKKMLKTEPRLSGSRILQNAMLLFLLSNIFRGVEWTASAWRFYYKHAII
jgi:hypothetical protein